MWNWLSCAIRFAQTYEYKVIAIRVQIFEILLDICGLYVYLLLKAQLQLLYFFCVLDDSTALHRLPSLSIKVYEDTTEDR